MSSLKRREYVVVLAALILGASTAFAKVSPERRAQAVAAYEKAQEMHTALEGETAGKRRPEEYRKVIDAYIEVYRLDPAYNKAPVALTAAAELNREMGREFSSDSYFLEAIKSYRLIMEQYPQITLTRGAAFTVGDIYRLDLEDPDDARRAYQDFIKMYPRDNKAPQAEEILEQLETLAAKTNPDRAPPPAGGKAAEMSMNRPALPPTEEVAENETNRPATAPAETRPEGPSSGVRKLTAVRHWVGLNYLRIVIELDGDAKFDSVRLSNPDRIVINLLNARLSTDLGAKTFPVENGYLRQIRVAQFSTEVARVVLDVEKVDSYSIFSLPNPFRLVIDVQGASPTRIASGGKPGSSAGAPKADTLAPPASAAPGAPSPTSVGRVETAARSSLSAPGIKSPAAASVSGEAGTPALNPPPASESPKPAGEATETAATGGAPAIPPAAPTEAGARTLTRALGLKIGRIVIDPGHGGHDTGTIGPTGLQEKDVVLDVGLKLKKLLERNTECEVVMTRSDDTFIPLEERTAIANEKGADLFLSIHANASQDETARGIETYYLNFTSSQGALEVAARENASSQEAVHQLQDLIKKIAMTEKIEESQDFARQIQHEVYTRVTKASGAQRDRGIKKAPFVVLIGANMPSVLAEISFLTNPRDERLLRRSDYREKIAYALYEGVLDYLKTLGEVGAGQKLAAQQTSSANHPDF